MEASLFYIASGMLLITSLLILIVLLYVLQIIRLLLVPPQPVAAPTAVRQPWLSKLRKRFVTGDLKPVAQEQSILLDHNYDGIRELDHRMPPWLAWFFYGTVAFAIIYLVNFWVLDAVPTSEKEYTAEVERVEKQIAEYRKTVAAGIDENTATLTTDAAALETGKSLFAQNCQACHGSAAEGGVGPNLTDEYWLHGGTVSEVFKTIKYGVPDKGMIAWQQKLKPEEIQQVASYILSLQGTNPPNGKAPQGEKVAVPDPAHNKLSMK